MKPYTIVCGATALALMAWAAPVSAQGQATIENAAEANQNLAVSDVRSHDGAVSGTIFNRSSEPVRDVRLLIDHVWLWNNERHPGEVSPGRTDVYTVRGEIAPGGSLPFTFEGPALPDRGGGHFETHVQVTEFTQVGTSAADQPRTYEPRPRYQPAPSEQGRSYAPSGAYGAPSDTGNY